MCGVEINERFDKRGKQLNEVTLSLSPGCRERDKAREREGSYFNSREDLTQIFSRNLSTGAV